MQGFHTTQHPRRPQAGPAPHNPMDFAVLPGADLLSAGTSAASASSASALDHHHHHQIRVPLLPDNFAPARSPTVGHAPEVPDAPLAAPEIVVLAADPSRVNAVSPLSEVEGMGPDGVELMFVHDDHAAGGESAGGMLRGLWDGVVDDVLGGGGAQGKPAV